jgi:phosphoenolpyruvate carboxylase
MLASRHALRAVARRAVVATAAARPGLTTTQARCLVPPPIGYRAFSSFSSFDEPHPTLFDYPGVVPSTEELEAAASDRDSQLRNDIRMMGSILGQVIKEYNGEAIFRKIEDMRALAKAWREAGSGRVPANADSADKSFQQLASYASSLTDKELFVISRSFTHFLALANAAEAHHRARMLKKSDTEGANAGALHSKPDSCGLVLQNLLQEGHSADAIWEALVTQSTELVLTAHPTEVNRKTILEKKRRIQVILDKADMVRFTGASSFDRAELDDAMYREISGIWLSDEVSRYKPSPEMEAEKGTLIIDSVLWETVPRFLRKLDATANEFLGKRLPLDASPIRFASWMGGDRDGVSSTLGTMMGKPLGCNVFNEPRSNSLFLFSLRSSEPQR